VVGAGGLGSPLIMYLAAARGWRHGIIDDDSVSIDNLQRQVAYTTADAGASKAERAAAFCQSLNPHVAAEAMPFRLTAENALEIVSRYDIVADGSDNFATRYLVNGRVLFRQKTHGFRGAGPVRRLHLHLPGLRDGRGRAAAAELPLPIPEAPPPGRWQAARRPACWVRCGRAGHAAAVEVIKEVLGIGEGLAGRLLIYESAFRALPDHRAEVGPG